MKTRRQQAIEMLENRQSSIQNLLDYSNRDIKRHESELEAIRTSLEILKDNQEEIENAS